jgi:hypothetical protein
MDPQDVSVVLGAVGGLVLAVGVASLLIMLGVAAGKIASSLGGGN